MDSATIRKIRDSFNPKPRNDYENAENAKQAQCGTAIGNNLTGRQINSDRASSAEELVAGLAQESDYAKRRVETTQTALDFFEANPAFAEFLQHLRSGVISIY